jgi:hypothetical protein
MEGRRLVDQILSRHLVSTFFQDLSDAIDIHIGDQHGIVVRIGGRRIFLEKLLIRLDFFIIDPCRVAGLL